jgi:hypothetical protein
MLLCGACAPIPIIGLFVVSSQPTPIELCWFQSVFAAGAIIGLLRIGALLQCCVA